MIAGGEGVAMLVDLRMANPFALAVTLFSSAGSVTWGVDARRGLGEL